MPSTATPSPGPAAVSPPVAAGAGVSASRTDRVKAYKQAEGTRTPAEREADVLRHLPLVHTVVDRICAHLPATVDRDDLFHAGVIGLIDALNRFDPGRDNAFSTYAVLRIRGQIIDELRDRDWVPRTARERARDYRQAVDELSAQHQRPPTDAELAARLRIPESELPALELHAHLAAQVSLDAPTGDDERLGTTLARREDLDADPTRFIDAEDRKRVLVRILGTLSDQERMVIKLYYFEQLLMKEIAAVLGVTESRICQIHARVIEVLRARCKGMDLF